MHWTLQWCLAKIQQTWDDFFINFSPKIIGKLLRCCVFPWGRAYHFPKDDLAQALAKSMLSPSALLDSITSNTQRIEVVERAFTLAVASYPINKKLQAAYPHVIRLEEKLASAQKAGILTKEEVRLWQESKAARLALIQVDEFAPDYFSSKSL